MPAAHGLPVLANGVARADDHALAAMTLCMFGELADRRRLGGEHELAPPIGHAANVRAFDRDRDVRALGERSIVQEHV